MVGCKDNTLEADNKIDDPEVVKQVIYQNLTEDEDGNLNLTLKNSVESFKFYNEITTSYDYIVSTDIEGKDVITSKTCNLNLGENIFYLTFLDNDNVVSCKKVILYRNHMYSVRFQYCGAVDVEEGNLVKTIDLPEVSYYKSNKWDFDFNTPILADTYINLDKTPIEYPISIDLDGGSGNYPTSINTENYNKEMNIPKKNIMTLQDG